MEDGTELESILTVTESATRATATEFGGGLLKLYYVPVSMVWSAVTLHGYTRLTPRPVARFGVVPFRSFS